VNQGDKFAIWDLRAAFGRSRRAMARSIDWTACIRNWRIASRWATALLYLGNYLGGGDPVTTIDRLLAFRTYLLAAPGMFTSDIVYLRGMQEEIWAKLLQIQFAPNRVKC